MALRLNSQLKMAMKSSRSARRLIWRQAPDIEKRIKKLVKDLEFNHIVDRRIFCFRSFGSSSRAKARIWSLPRIWQKALGQTPAYCVEVLAEKFDKLSEDEKTQILIHELLHVPKNFSGTLLPHYRRRRGLSHQLFKSLAKRKKK